MKIKCIYETIEYDELENIEWREIHEKTFDAMEQVEAFKRVLDINRGEFESRGVICVWDTSTGEELNLNTLPSTEKDGQKTGFEPKNKENWKSIEHVWRKP